MPNDATLEMWTNVLSDGTPHEIIWFAWSCITENGALSAFCLMLWTLVLRFVLISVYFSVMYVILAYMKKHLHKKLSVRANVYCWYTLLLSFVLAYLPLNNGLMALPAHLLTVTPEWLDVKPYIFIALSLFTTVWLLSAVYRLLRLARMNGRIRKSIKRLERFDDNDALAARAAESLDLRKMPDILTAEHIETPVSYGFFRKTVLLPVNYKEKYSDSELYLLLLHEMTHIKHGDTRKLFLLSIIEALLWVSPVMRSFVKSFKRDCELMCDNRVVGLENSERDLYGKLILKECAYKTARFGFGFSDSYHAIENRLDALYRYKAGKTLKMLAIIPIMALLICVAAYIFRADLIAVNDNYNTAFNLLVLDGATGEYVSVPPELCVEAYELQDDGVTMSIMYNDDAILEHLSGYAAADGTISVKAVSDNYTLQGAGISNGFVGQHNIQTGESDALGLVMIVGDVLEERTRAEELFLRLASLF